MLRKCTDSFTFRSFSISNVCGNIEKSKRNSEPSKTDINPGVLHFDFTPSELDKKILLWSGKYKSKEEIPPKISYSTLAYARSRLRIRAAHAMMVVGTISCLYYVFLGKYKRRKGETIAEMMESYNRR